MSSPVAPAVANKRRPIAELLVVAKLKLGTKSDWVAITEDAVWVGTVGPNAVQKIDPLSNRVSAIVELPGKPLAGLALGFGALWAPTCGDPPSLARIDLATSAIAGVFPVPFVAPEGGVTTGAGSVWLVIDDAGTLARIDPQSGAIQRRIQTAAGSYNPLFFDGLLWLSQATAACVRAIDPATNAVIAVIETGPGPRFIAAADGRIWTLNQGDGSLTGIDARTKSVFASEPLRTPGLGGDITVAGGVVWTSMPGVPLTATDARTGRMLCQWEGPGGDSLGVGHGAIWLIHVQRGELSRIDLDDALARCRA